MYDGTGSGVSAVLPLSLVPLPSSSLERLVHREAWLVPPEAVAECALALVSARLELVGEPPGLVEGTVGREALHGVLVGVGALLVGASVTAVAVVELQTVTHLERKVPTVIVHIS